MAEAAGLPFRTYQNMEQGAIPQAQTLEMVAKAFGVPETRLFLDLDLVERPTPEDALAVITNLVRAFAAPSAESLSPVKRTALSKLASLDDSQVNDLLLLIDTLAIDTSTATSDMSDGLPINKRKKL